MSVLPKSSGSSPGEAIGAQGTTTNVATGATVYLAPDGMNQSYSYDAFGNINSSDSFNFSQS